MKKLFKTAVITDEISQDFETALKLAAKYKLDGVELRSAWETPPEKLDGSQIEKIEKLLSEYSQKIIAVSSSIFKCDWGVSEEEKLEKTIALAKRFNCGFIRGFSFWKAENYNDADFVLVLKKLEKRLIREGLVLLLENDPAVNLTNGAALARVLKLINSPNVKAVWDPGNDLYDPLGETPYPDGYGFIKDYAAHIHLKDAVRRDGKTVGVAFGCGEANLFGQLKALHKDGYQGYIVIETHYKKNKAIDDELLKNPVGSAFSEGGLEATEECIIKLNKMIKAIAEQKESLGT